MSLAAELAAVMAKHGAPTLIAVGEAEKISARLLPIIERANRNKAIKDLFPIMGWQAICERFGIHHSTAYRALKFSHQTKVLAKEAE